ncbi:hypothetical protein L7F22_049495 [Adiantum nelumboides]|nr:hypothetical protein [Adiantum nelumboides]
MAVWDKLKASYENTTPINQVHLMRKLVSLELDESKSISDHLNAFGGILSQLKDSSLQAFEDDKLKAIFLLMTLPDSWEALVVSLSNNPKHTLWLICRQCIIAIFQEKNAMHAILPQIKTCTIKPTDLKEALRSQVLSGQQGSPASNHVPNPCSGRLREKVSPASSINVFRKGKEKVDKSMRMFNVTKGHEDVDGDSSGSEHSIDEELRIPSVRTPGVRRLHAEKGRLAAMQSHVGLEETGFQSTD